MATACNLSETMTTPCNSGFNLKEAVNYNHVACVKKVLSAGAEVNQSDSYYDTPLTHAIRKDYGQYLKEIVESGAHMNTGSNE